MRPFEEKSPWVDNSQFQSDDFPALSGFQRPKQLADNDEQTVSTQKSTEASAKPADESPVDSVPTVEVKTCIETLPDGTMENIPATMLTDQFGMAGLVASLRDQAGNPLAFGTDLQNLGLKYHSSVDSLCTNFAGPWDGRSTLIQDIEVNVPEEYKMKLEKKPHVYATMRKAGVDLLFYLFYHCPNEIYQLIAASELHRRDWRFHKTEKIWVTRSTSGILEHTQTYEKGTFNVFDPLQGRQMPRAMTLEYRLLEDRPIVPTGLTDPPLFRSGPAMTNMPPQMFHQQQAGPSHTHRQSRAEGSMNSMAPLHYHRSGMHSLPPNGSAQPPLIHRQDFITGRPAMNRQFPAFPTGPPPVNHQPHYFRGGQPPVNHQPHYFRGGPPPVNRQPPHYFRGGPSSRNSSAH